MSAAEKAGWREFTEVVRYWVLAADPDGVEPKEQVAGRSFSSHKTSDGMVKGSFNLDPLTGHILQTAVELESQRIRAEEDAGDPTLRTVSQRRADALARLVDRGAKSPNGKTTTPLLHLVMSERVAAEALSRLDDSADVEDLQQLPLRHRDVDGRCELIDGTPIHPQFGVAALALAELRRIVLGADSEIKDLGRGVRCFPIHLKQALLVQARGRCDVPACDAPASWLQADHLIPWGRWGPTNIANGCIKCQPHNREKRDRLPVERKPTPQRE